MFFKKKKEEKPKKKTWDEKLEDFAKKYGLPKENIEYIVATYLNPSIGLLKILARASPDGSYKRVAKALSAEKRPSGYILGGSANTHTTKNRAEYNPKAVHLPLLHGFLTLALVHHMGESSTSIGDAIGDALYDWTDLGKGWEELKKNPEEFAEYVLDYLEQNGSVPINRDATKDVIVRAIQKSAKVLDKMIPTVESLKHLKATSHAVSGAVDDPFVVLRNAGIDIEPELEEFRQFLAEISGKKIE